MYLSLYGTDYRSLEPWETPESVGDPYNLV